MNGKLKIVTNGLLKENPSLRLVLGTCPTLAVTTLAVNGDVYKRQVLETIQRTLTYVRMFRKDFKLEMLAQDEESRKAELAEKQKALSGAKKRMEDLDRIIQHIYEDNVLGKLSDSRYLKLSRQYEKEQAEIEQLAAVLEPVSYTHLRIMNPAYRQPFPSCHRGKR